jgi:DNA-binding FrmR family transcriptional regulator
MECHQRAEQAKRNVLTRLKRLENQVRRFRTLVEEDEGAGDKRHQDCEQIFERVQTMQRGMENLHNVILKSYLEITFRQAEDQERPEAAAATLENTASLLTKFID